VTPLSTTLADVLEFWRELPVDRREESV